MLHKAAGSGPTCNKEHSILLLIQPDRIYWCSCIKFQQIHTQRGSVCMCEVIRKVTVPPLSWSKALKEEMKTDCGMYGSKFLFRDGANTGLRTGSLFLSRSWCWQWPSQEMYTLHPNILKVEQHSTSQSWSRHQRNVVNGVFLSVTHQCVVCLHTVSWFSDIWVTGTTVDTDCPP